MDIDKLPKTVEEVTTRQQAFDIWMEIYKAGVFDAYLVQDKLSNEEAGICVLSEDVVGEVPWLNQSDPRILDCGSMPCDACMFGRET